MLTKENLLHLLDLHHLPWTRCLSSYLHLIAKWHGLQGLHTCAYPCFSHWNIYGFIKHNTLGSLWWQSFTFRLECKSEDLQCTQKNTRLLHPALDAVATPSHHGLHHATLSLLKSITATVQYYCGWTRNSPLVTPKRKMSVRSRTHCF